MPTSTAELTISPMVPEEAARAAGLHLAALPCGFFPQLGPRFMAAYYRTFIDSPHAVALAARLEGRRAGFLVGTLNTTAHYHWVVRHRGVHLGLLALAGLLVRPGIAAAFVRTRLGRYVRGLLRFGRRRAAADEAESGAGGLPVAVLAHVAVERDVRGSGAGRRLVDAFVELARAGGAGQGMLVTLDGPQGAGAFWDAQGWERWGSHVNADGCRVARYRLPLRPA